VQERSRGMGNGTEHWDSSTTLQGALKPAWVLVCLYPLDKTSFDDPLSLIRFLSHDCICITVDLYQVVLWVDENGNH